MPSQATGILGRDVFRGATASVFVSSSFLKAYEIYSGSWELQLLIIALSFLEFGFGLSLLAFWGRPICLAGMLIGFVFFAVSGVTLFSGSSCHCFGQDTPPSVAMLVDAVILFGFAFGCLTCNSGAAFDMPRPLGASLGAAVAGVFLLVTITGSRAASIPQRVWDNESLIGRHVDELLECSYEPPIREGSIRLGVLKSECKKCVDYHRRHIRNAQKTHSSIEPKYIAIVNAGDSWKIGPGEWTLMDICTRGETVHFSGGEPYVQTPLTLFLLEGIVVPPPRYAPE